MLTAYVIGLRHCLLLRAQDVQGEGTMELNSSGLWDFSSSAGVDGLGQSVAESWREASLRESGTSGETAARCRRKVAE